MKNALACAGLALCLFAGPLDAQTEWTSSRPDGHAPIGVMGDHTHEQGEFMFSYRFMQMDMEGIRDGTNRIRSNDVVSTGGQYRFMVTPTEMEMGMHMVGMMYAPSDRVTLMGMVNYLSSSMEHVTRTGTTFTTEASGLGDVGLGALVGLKRSGPTRLHLNLGVTLPTGSIEKTGVTPASGGNAVQLPYPMQLGTGTVGLRYGFTYLGMAERVSWGGQALGESQLGENDRGWTVGDRWMGTFWFAGRLADRVSLSARAKYQVWSDYSGVDPDLNPMMVPTARTDLRGGKRFDVPLGINYWIDSGPLSGLRFLAEYEIPVWQSLGGPQLARDGAFTIGAQLSVG